jgi:hypothetical protein
MFPCHLFSTSWTKHLLFFDWLRLLL